MPIRNGSTLKTVLTISHQAQPGLLQMFVTWTLFQPGKKWWKEKEKSAGSGQLVPLRRSRVPKTVGVYGHRLRRFCECGRCWIVKGYDFTTGGAGLGIDYRPTEHFVVGLMGGYSPSWTDLAPSVSVDVDEGWGGVYSGYFHHGFYVNGAVYGGHYTFRSEHAALLGMANGSSSGGELITYLASGYDFHLGHLRIGPLAALQYTVASLGGFTERGSIAPPKVSSDSQEELKPTGF